MVVIFVGKYPYNSTIYLKVDGHGTKFQFDQKKNCMFVSKKNSWKTQNIVLNDVQSC